MQKSKNIIIGAGLSGLSCAAALKDCLVLEKESAVGGLSRTLEFDGFRFDLGGHRFFTQDHKIEQLVRELLGDDLLIVERKSKIYRDKKFIDYPLRISLLLQLNPWQIFLSFLAYLYRKTKPLGEHSFKERAINRFGDYLYQLFFRDYTRKVWGIPCDILSMELVDIRLQNISLMKTLQHAFKKNNIPNSFIHKFIYPKEGIGRLAESLSKDLDVRLNAEITGIICSPGKIEKIVMNGSEELVPRNLISTMPITKLVKFLNPPEEVKIAAQGLKYRSLILVFLMLNKKHFTENHWIYFPDGEIFGRLSEPKNWSSFMALPDKTGICMEIFCNRNDAIWKMADTLIAQQVIQDLPLIKESEVEKSIVVRVEYAYPVYDIHYKEKLEILKKFLFSYKNLFVLGRTGSFNYINIDTCIEKGLALGYSLRENKL